MNIKKEKLRVYHYDKITLGHVILIYNVKTNTKTQKVTLRFTNIKRSHGT